MLTVKQAAERLKVCRARVQQFITEGRLNAVQLASGAYVMDANELKRFESIERKPGRKSKKRD